ncbi:MAG: O-antigen ligase family protein [Planctomycetota bacterium]
MSTTIAAIIATLITTGMTSAVSHQFTQIGGCVAAVILTVINLLSRNARIYPTFLFGSLSMCVIVLLSSEANIADFSSTIYVLSCYLALIGLCTASEDSSSFCRQLIMGNNLLLTAWVLHQASKVDGMRAWQISNPAGAGNAMAAQINMTLPFVIVSFHQSRGFLKAMYLALLGANSAAVFFIMSRNGIGCMLMIFTLYVLFDYRRIAIFVCAGISFLAASFDSIAKLPVIREVLVRFRFVDYTSTTPRSLIWRIAKEHIVRNPMLGVGPGKTKEALSVIETYHAHNNIIQVVLESGIPAGIIITLLTIMLLCLPVRMIFGSREGFLCTLPVLAYLGFSVTATPLVYPAVTFLLVACVNEARVAIQRDTQQAVARRSSPFSRPDYQLASVPRRQLV